MLSRGFDACASTLIPSNLFFEFVVGAAADNYFSFACLSTSFVGGTPDSVLPSPDSRGKLVHI